MPSTDDDLNALLSASLHRTGCTDAMTLVDYEAGLVDDESEVVQAHLVQYRYCRAEWSGFPRWVVSEPMIY